MEIETIKRFCTNKEYLDKLLEVHHEFTKNRCENSEQIKKLEKEKEELRQRLCDLSKTKDKLRMEKLSLLKKLENNKQREKIKDVSQYFNTLSEFLGYSISDNISFNKELRIHYIECHYNKECFAVFEIASAGNMNLRQIVPHHPNFDSIQEHFWNTQDSVSLLSNLRKYFSAIETTEVLADQN